MRTSCLQLLNELCADESGQTMAEYGLMAAVLGVAMLAGVAALQSETGSVLGATAAGWTGIAQSPP